METIIPGHIKDWKKTMRLKIQFNLMIKVKIIIKNNQMLITKCPIS